MNRRDNYSENKEYKIKKVILLIEGQLLKTDTYANFPNSTRSKSK